jgi:tRNA-uridine aminocarboxypropyltransferase
MQQDGASEPAAPEDGPQPAVDNRLFVLVLQHPQERVEPRATAAMTVAALRRARLVVGLSWPNLTRALGWPTGSSPDPRRWGVLYLGSARPHPPSQPGRPNGPPDRGEIIALDRGGNPLPDPDRVLRGLEGVVLLDGTWSQAKTLWWRNPWLLKLQRLVLNPTHPARFGRLRREPRPDALSTLEAASLVLRHVEAGPEAADTLEAALDGLIAALGGQPGGVTDHGATDSGAGGRWGGRRERRQPWPRQSRRYRGRSAAG